MWYIIFQRLAWHKMCSGRHLSKISTGSEFGRQALRRAMGTFQSGKFVGKVCEKTVTTCTKHHVLHQDQVVMNQLAVASSLSDVFVVVNSNEVLMPSQVSATLQTLDKLIFRQLAALPWAIYNNHIMLYIQSYINSEAKEIFQPLLQCSEFDRLCHEADKLRTDFGNRDLVNVTLCLLKLHISEDSQVFTNLVLECLTRHKEFNVEDLLTLSNTANFMKRSGFHISSQVAQALDAQWGLLNVDDGEQHFVTIVRLLYNVGYFMTKEVLWKYQGKLTQMLRTYQDTIHPCIVIELLETLKRFVSIKPEMHQVALHIFEKRMDRVTLWQLSRSAFFVQDLNGIVRDRVIVEAQELLKECESQAETWRIADIVTLLNLHHLLGYPNNSDKNLERLLEPCVQHLDILHLKYVAYTKVIWNSRNQTLVNAFCHRVQEKLDDLLDSLSCLVNVTQCLSKTPNRPDKFDKIFSKHLIHQVLDQQMGTQPQHVGLVGRYLTQCFGNMDRHSLGLVTSKLLGTLPHFSMIDISYIGLGIMNFHSSSVRTHSEQLITNFAREILLRRKEITDINMLNLLVKSVFGKLKGIFRGAVIQDLVELYAIHAKSLDVPSIFHVATTLADWRLCMPEMCDQLASVTARNLATISFPAVAQTLNVFAKCSYHPENLKDLQEIVTLRTLQSLERCDWEEDISSILTAALSLAILNQFPEPLIKMIFSLKFLTRLDSVLSSDISFRKKKHLEVTLAELNRCVVVQCPQFLIPWFCGDPMMNEQRIEYKHLIKWKNTLHQGLLAALGGEEFIKSGPLYTPYNHTYDFECLLDENGHQLPITSQTWHTRVAIMLMTPSNYCSNNRCLLGYIENRVLQCEILGWKVVVMPYYHLDSMMLSDSESIQKYCASKIFT